MSILPLSGLLALEGALAAMLCVPFNPVTKIALMITGLFKQQAIKIILATLGAVLLIVLVFSGIRIQHLQDVMTRPVATSGTATVFHESRQEMYSEGIQSCLIVSCLLVGMTIIRIDEQIRRNKSLQANFDVMMKQAKGTQQEYMRQLEEKTKAGAGSSPSTGPGVDEAAAHLRRENAKLKGDNDDLERELRKAGASAAALKKQTEGLQLEFTRLLDENESLRSQLSLFDRKYSTGDEKKRS